MAAAALIAPGRRPEAVRLFVASAGNHVMREIADTFAAGFAASGVPADVAVDVQPVADPARGLLQLVVAPHEFYPLYAARGGIGNAIAALPAVHVLNVEQPGSPWFESACWYAREAAGVLDINAMSAAALRRRGLNAVHAPLAYLPPPVDLSPVPARDVDIVFLGVLTPRREMFLARHADFLAGQRCAIHLARIEQPRLATTPGFVTGQALSRLLRSSRVLLNIHGEKRLLRVAPHAAGGGARLRGGFRGRRPRAAAWRRGPGHRGAGSPRRRMPPPARRRGGAGGHGAARATAGRRGAGRGCGLPPLDGHDHGSRAWGDPGVPGGRQSASVRRWAGRANGAARAIAARFGPRTAAPAVDPQPTPPLADSAARAAERAERREQARRMALAGQPLAHEEANAAAREGVVPGVTVVITVYNYAAHVGQALKSACDALTDGIPGGIEVVVVDDGSTDDSAARVETAMAASTTPVRLIRKALNTGLADARNLGLREARAPYLFILDADNWIYPRGIAVLHEAIRGGGLDAVYGIIAKVDGLGQPAGVTSCFAWDERELVRMPYVDAMALFDRRAVLEVDGYSTDLAWMGWEDYDLWLKLAQAGKRCALVPELLSAYRVHPASMIHETNRHADALAGHLRRKFAPLASRYPDLPTLFGFPRE